MARTCSLIFIVLDVLKPLMHKKIIEKELEGFGIRLNKDVPQITLRKKDKGISVEIQTLRSVYALLGILSHVLVLTVSQVESTFNALSPSQNLILTL